MTFSRYHCFASLVLLLGLLAFPTKVLAQSVQLADIQGAWQTEEGAPATLSIVNGLPVLNVRDRVYQGSTFTPSGFQVVFRPQKVEDFKNPNLPNDVRQQLIDRHYEQHGQVTIANPDTLTFAILLDGAQYQGETDSIQKIDPRVRQLQLTLHRPTQNYVITRVELISRPPSPEAQKALQDQLDAAQKSLEEQGHLIDEILTRKNKALARIQALIDATQKAVQEKEQALSALLSPHNHGRAAREERLQKEALLKADQEELDKTLAQLEALRPLIQPLNDRYKSENFSYWPGDLTPAEEAVYKSNKTLLQRRDALWKETDTLKAEIANLRRTEEDAIREDKAEADYQWKNNSDVLEQYQTELSQLYEKRRQLHDKTNQEITPWLTEASAAQTELDTAYAKRSEMIRAQLALWDELFKQLPPLEQEVSIEVDHQPVFNYAADKTDLAELNQEMADFQVQLEQAHLLKQKFMDLFISESKLAMVAGDKLAGDYKNGLLGNGLIMESARNQAIIDFGIDLIEIAEEGIKFKGLWGAIVEGFRKAVLNTSYYYMDKGLEVDGVNPAAIEAAVNEAYNTALTDPLYTPQLAKTGFSRVVDQVTPEFFTLSTDALFRPLPKGVKRLFPSRALKRANVISEQFFDKFSDAVQMKKASLSLLEGVTKDIIKTGLKQRYFLKESAGWQEYFQHDLNARLTYAQYNLANSAYWKALEAYNQYVREKIETIQAERQKNQSTVALATNIPLKVRQTLAVKTKPKHPTTRETTRLDQTTLPIPPVFTMESGFKCLNTPCNQLILQVHSVNGPLKAQRVW